MLLGTPYRSDHLSGRRIADGTEATVVLLREIDCSRLESSSHAMHNPLL